MVLAAITWEEPDDSDGFSYEVTADEQNDTSILTVTQDQDGTQVEILVVTVNRTSGEYTVAQSNPAWHQGDNTEDNIDLDLTYQVEDADGDVATGSLTVRIDDDTPTGTVNDGDPQNPMYIVDDDDLENGNEGGIYDDDATVPPSSLVLEHSFGADGAGAITWEEPGDSDGFSYEVTADEQNNTSILTVTQDQNGQPVEILVVTVNRTSGEYTVAQSNPAWHQGDNTEDNIDLDLTYQVEDADGDVATGSLTVRIDDDTPVCGKSTEDENPAGPTAFSGTMSLISTSSTSTQSQTVTETVNGHVLTATAYGFGGEQAEVYQGVVGAGVVTEGESTGPYQEINYNIDTNGNHTTETLVIKLDDNTFATQVSLELSAFFSNDTEAENGKVLFYYQGDLVGEESFSSADDTGNQNIVALPNNSIFDEIRIQAVDDDKQGVGDNSDLFVKSVIFDSNDVVEISSGTLGGEYGADGPGSFTFADSQTTELFLQDGTTPVTLTVSDDGSRVTGTYLDGDDTKQAFVLEITDAVEGTYQLTQLVGLHHDKNALFIRYVITDGDGDGKTCDVEISIPDSIPVGGSTTLSLDENTLVDETDNNQTSSNSLGFTSGDDLSSIKFVDPNGYTITVTGEDETVSAPNISWDLIGDELIGFVGTERAIKLTLENDIANKSTVVKAELLGPGLMLIKQVLTQLQLKALR